MAQHAPAHTAGTCVRAHQQVALPTHACLPPCVYALPNRPPYAHLHARLRALAEEVDSGGVGLREGA